VVAKSVLASVLSVVNAKPFSLISLILDCHDIQPIHSAASDISLPRTPHIRREHGSGRESAQPSSSLRSDFASLGGGLKSIGRINDNLIYGVANTDALFVFMGNCMVWGGCRDPRLASEAVTGGLASIYAFNIMHSWLGCWKPPSIFCGRHLWNSRAITGRRRMTVWVRAVMDIWILPSWFWRLKKRVLGHVFSCVSSL
jgi:hypothetical protein